MEIKNNELHRVTATAIIRKDGKYLIIRRSLNKKAFPGKWTVPGGGIEVTDYINLPKNNQDSWYYAIENALRREVMEETSLEIENIKYLLDVAFIRPDDIPVITISYYCDWKSGNIKLNDENIDYKWIIAEEAKKCDLIEGIAEEIEMVDKIFKGENSSKVEFKYKNN